ncbi:fatty acid oxidation complex subunit alpha FadB [Marinobacterium sp. YM272]|uniref:fatty acid oxidation complex subunit alpha FadB n=1 Tax=Marinobacterium sp. YM272 TaxID=3421654 RepID=UPI003D7F9063
MFSGDSLTLLRSDAVPGLVELVIDRKGSSVNSIGSAFLSELSDVCDLLENEPGIQGLLIRSAKPTFVAGADVFEFPALFEGDSTLFQRRMEQAHQLFNRLEALPFPTVSAINGLALGGGLELALTSDARVIDQSAKVGFPEVTLGLCPGWGGTVRASRMAGVEAALELMISGKPVNAEKAMVLGLADESVPSDRLRDASLALLKRMIDGEINYPVLRDRKQQPVASADLETLKSTFAKSLNPNYPAAGEIIELVAGHASLTFDAALAAERDSFLRLGATTSTQSLVGLFINGQRVKQASKAAALKAVPVKETAVLGAGIMGGGIAYQSAVSGTPVILKDIRQESLDLGMSTASKVLDKLIKRGRMDQAGKNDCLGLIQPTLAFEGFERVGLVVEAVVENEAVKRAVLAETEAKLSPDAILTSNTSTISISALAGALTRPQNFCGMHFFNPVPMMPLVEVIRGEQSSETAIATAVDCAVKMGKTPIVVNDCPGFLVNRVLFPYFNAFNRLLHDGVDFQRIDRVMEAFGWPMGPAYLADVIGLDTMVHADQVLQAGYPERMGHENQPIIERLLEQGALGQKNGRGFYDYAEGPHNKQASTEVLELIRGQVKRQVQLSDQEIVDRMMIPLCLESFLCLDEGVVASPAELDMALILGLGFPKFRGGALRYIDHVGADEFAARVEKWGAQGPLYRLPESFRAHCRGAKRFF